MCWEDFHGYTDGRDRLKICSRERVHSRGSTRRGILQAHQTMRRFFGGEADICIYTVGVLYDFSRSQYHLNKKVLMFYYVMIDPRTCDYIVYQFYKRLCSVALDHRLGVIGIIIPPHDH